jgi:hypothetical protein
MVYMGRHNSIDCSGCNKIMNIPYGVLHAFAT